MDLSALLASLCFIDSTGYNYADYPTFLSYVTQLYQSIYGTDIYLGADSQDGQIVAAQAQMMYNAAVQGASTFNSFSPATAQGVGLSRNVKTNGLARELSSNSTADLTIVGQVGTVITNGIAIDTLSQQWLLPITVTIPSGGSVIATATAANTGAVTAAPTTITGIYTPTLGWQSVTNAAAATVGQAVETDAALRARQAVSTSLPAETVFAATIGALENLSGVTQVKGYENVTSTTDGNGQPGNSVQCFVLGGDGTAIAQTIALYKTPGTNPYGTTYEQVTDSRGMPLNIGFSRPIVAEIGVQITLAPRTGWTTDYEALISSAVATVIGSAELSAEGFGIGNNVLITQLYGPAYLGGTPASGTFNISSIELKKNTGAFAATDVTINYNEYPECNPAVDVTFVVT